MKIRWVVLPIALLVLGLIALTAADDAKAGKPASPVYGVTVPDGYRRWQFIASAREAAPFDELRVVLGNAIAVRAYRKGTLPFPDGSVLVKLAWKEVQSPDFASATIPGAATSVQVMVKDSKKYAASGGWGFGRFIGGVPTDEAQHRTCFACHRARVADRDFVFTRIAP
ncbi:cytochrome P460 family protein [Lysobacter auxotrophicus]|uniref:Cytochrome P460 family protein n=1 Tax=Lysobacter auxotrophicus TaxID=2992573 RepID=A0ABN6UJV7_9GAMM|nr:cytochrome P460 family protein [Lysobacter auxotrophicus]BDU16593.1 cytochrome P460 family protein [Lysobacter auxotrophicus]